MTPCYICQTPMDEIHVDPRDLKPRPCSECESIIDEAVGEMYDDDEEDYLGPEMD